MLGVGLSCWPRSGVWESDPSFPQQTIRQVLHADLWVHEKKVTAGGHGEKESLCCSCFFVLLLF